MCDHWQWDTAQQQRNMADRSLSVNGSFFLNFRAPHISVAGTTAMAPVSISGEGGGEFRPELTRPAWGCSDISHGCTLGSGLLLLQTTMSLYCEADKLRAETMGNSFQLLSALLKTDGIQWGNQSEGVMTTSHSADILGCPQPQDCICRLVLYFQMKGRAGSLALSYNQSGLKTKGIRPLDDIILTVFYNTISPSKFSSMTAAWGGHLSAAAALYGVVFGYWLGGQPTQSLLPSGHEVKVE